MKNIKNWLWYSWKLLAVLIIAALIAVRLIRNAFAKPRYDYQIAYIGSYTLPDDSIHEIEDVFASVSEDLNGDGKVSVHLNSYVDPEAEDSPAYSRAIEVQVIGDINDGDSYFYLMDAPEKTQLSYQILADPDGSMPEETDFSAEDKAVKWADTIFSSMDPGTYTEVISGQEISGSTNELLEDLYLGRRFYAEGKAPAQISALENLWDKITGE